ncbi:hypothetical protein ACF06T_28945 [Streptomyces albidoflavus]
MSAPAARPFVAALSVDLDGQRAKYECARPGCPHPLEGPVCATDRIRAANGALIPRGPGGVAAFVAGVKDHHLTTYHGSTR